MAYLLERSGRGDLVDRVAWTRNNAFIPELAGDPGFGPGWNGTSLATLGLNLFAPSRSSGWAGVISGGVGMLAGAVNLDGNG
jgi:hypothetical protein